MKRMLVKMRSYARTEKGEKTIVTVLTTLACVLVIDVVLLIIGELL